jgi:magnesium transporter
VTKEEVEEEEEEVEVEVTKEGEEDTQERGGTGVTKEEAARGSERFAADYIPLGIREPVYEVSG